jgi:hypothetical protein
LWHGLEEVGRLDLFPAKYRSQEALAEGDLVRWLTFGTELGCAPDEIELMRVYRDEGGSGDDGLLFYLFRFRTSEPHWAAKNGWMAGLAGPFRERDAPSPHSLGNTFSTMEPWESKTPEEHAERIAEIVAAYRRQAGGG